MPLRVIAKNSRMNADPPPPETMEAPASVWPPAPSVAPSAPESRKNDQHRTLTPYAWLDIVLGLPAGLLGALLLYGTVGVLSDLVSPPPSSDAKMRLGFCVSASLITAACFFLVRRFPLFGILLITGALILLVPVSLLVWL